MPWIRCHLRMNIAKTTDLHNTLDLDMLVFWIYMTADISDILRT